jgi:hypothetical protein
LGFLIILLGIITAVLQLIPPSDSAFAVGWRLSFDPTDFETTLIRLTHAYMPIPPFKVGFWNSYAWMSNSFVKYLAVLFVCSFIVFSSVGFLGKPYVTFLFVGCTAGLLTFFHMKYGGFIRHHGFLFITFIMSAWIYRCSHEFNWSFLPDAVIKRWEILFSYGLTAVLLLHVGGSLVAASIDYQHPFSASKSVAEYINERGLNNKLIVGYPDYATSSIVGYLGIRGIYYPESGRVGSYIRYDTKEVKVTEQEVIDKARQLTYEKSEGALIICKNPLGDDFVRVNKLQKLGEFTGAVVYDENFYIYSLTAQD